MPLRAEGIGFEPFEPFGRAVLTTRVGKTGHMPPPGYLYEQSDVSGDTRLRGRPATVAPNLGAALARRVVGFVDVRTWGGRQGDGQLPIVFTCAGAPAEADQGLRRPGAR